MSGLSLPSGSRRPERPRDHIKMCELRTAIKRLRPDGSLRERQECAEILYDFMEDQDAT